MEVIIRKAEEKDVKKLVEIYNHEVRTTESNYETTLQTVEARTEWLKRLQSLNYPVLVAVEKDEVVGFAALTPFHPLSGYKHTATGSIYLDEKHQGIGIGKKIAEALLAAAYEIKIHTIIAGINSENKRSIALMKSMGFVEAGYFREIGTKNGKWLDDVCLQLVL